MNTILGLGKTERQRLSAVVRYTKGTISVDETAGILQVSATDAAKMLSRWLKKGWLLRVRRGLYVPIPIESQTADISLGDAWVIADRLFAPCYIGGWTAAEHWDLTEQIFRTILVFTTQKPRERSLYIKGTRFLLRTVSEKNLFGLSSVWRGQVKIAISDPTRTIIDMLNDPLVGGGIRPTIDMFICYLKSKDKNIELIMEYAKRLSNGAVFKRLGFLLERLAPEEDTTINECLSALTKGNAKLDPTLAKGKLFTRWRLWLPKNWDKDKVMTVKRVD